MHLPNAMVSTVMAAKYGVLIRTEALTKASNLVKKNSMKKISSYYSES